MFRAGKRIAVVASPIIGLGAWSAFVFQERSREPRDIRFEIGSPDDILADQLKTGDVLLFSRRWTHMLPLGAALSVAKKQVTGSQFDHAAVIVNDRFGVPHVAEVTYSGVKLRRFDERILRSRCNEILLVPVSLECDEDDRAKVERHVKGMTLRPTKNILMLEFIGIFKLLVGSTEEGEKRPDEGGSARGSTEGSPAGTGSDISEETPGTFRSFVDSVTVNPPAQLVMSCLDRLGVVDFDKVVKWKRPQLLTPKDFEDGVVPLSGGARFGEPLPVRLRD